MLFLNLLIGTILQVLVNGHMSTKVFNKGSPQVGVLSPLLFIKYIDSFRTQVGSYLVNFLIAVDTALRSLLEDSDHGCVLPAFVKLCDGNFLDFNVSKTKALIIDFRHNRNKLKVSIMHGDDAEIVHT